MHLNFLSGQKRTNIHLIRGQERANYGKYDSTRKILTPASAAASACALTATGGSQLENSALNAEDSTPSEIRSTQVEFGSPFYNSQSIRRGLSKKNKFPNLLEIEDCLRSCEFFLVQRSTSSNPNKELHCSVQQVDVATARK